MRALSFTWPAYRLQVALNILTAVVAWMTVVIIIPLCEQKFWEDTQKEQQEQVLSLAEKLTQRNCELNEIIIRLNQIPGILGGHDG